MTSIIKIRESTPNNPRLEELAKQDWVKAAYAVTGHIDGIVISKNGDTRGIDVKVIKVDKPIGENYPAILEIRPRLKLGLRRSLHNPKDLERLTSYLMKADGVENIYVGSRKILLLFEISVIWPLLKLNDYRQLNTFQKRLYEECGECIRGLETYCIFDDFARRN